MARIDEVVERVLREEPHLTRAEAIRFVAMGRDKSRKKRQAGKNNQLSRGRNKKGKEPKGRIRTVSGGAVSPR